MNPRIILAPVIAVHLAGCLAHEGMYSPACIAYAGSTIELSDGRFVWEKFTDSIVVDEEGEVVNQFPGYPMQGTYETDGQTVHMATAAGDALPDMYLHEHDNHHYLLTAEQFEAWQKSGDYADCALMLGENSAD